MSQDNRDDVRQQQPQPRHSNGGMSYKTMAAIAGVIGVMIIVVGVIASNYTVKGTVTGVEQVIIRQNEVAIGELKRMVGDLQKDMQDIKHVMEVKSIRSDSRFEQLEKREDRREP